MTRRRWPAAVRGLGMAGALALGAAVSGCLPPSEQRIFEDLSLERQRTYEVWKTKRQEQTDETILRGNLSLEDAIKVALQNNKSLKQMLEERGVARGRVVESYQLALPSVTFSGAYSRFQDIGEQPWQNLNQYSAGLTVEQPLGQGVAIPAAMRTAKLYQALADENIRGQVQNVIYQTAAAYYDVLINQHLYDANNEAAISAAAHLRVVHMRRVAEVEAEFEVLRARVEVANFEAQKIIQQNAIDTTRTALLKIMGVSQESEIVLSDRLTFEPMKPVYERAVEIAFKNRSDLFASGLSVAMQQEAVRLAQSRWWPAFSAVFSQDWARPSPPSQMSHNHWGNDRWVAGVEGTWTLAGWDTAGKVMAEKANLRKSRLSNLDLHETALQEIRQAIYSVANAEELVQSQMLNNEMAGEALRLADVGYKNGKNIELDVIQARSALTDARSNYYSALHNHCQARLQLQIAMGILGPRPGPETTGTVPRELPAKPGHISEFTVKASEFDVGASTPMALDAPADSSMPAPEAKAPEAETLSAPPTLTPAPGAQLRVRLLDTAPPSAVPEPAEMAEAGEAPPATTRLVAKVTVRDL